MVKFHFKVLCWKKKNLIIRIHDEKKKGILHECKVGTSSNNITKYTILSQVESPRDIMKIKKIREFNFFICLS